MSECIIQNSEMAFFVNDLNTVAHKKEIPLHGSFELTPRCNFNCKMCYIHLTNEQANAIGRELSNEEWLNIARQAKDEGMLYLTLTGGEIFSRLGFKELYIQLSKMGFLITLLTNGYLIDEDVIGWLAEYPPYQMRITLYGASDDTYYEVCGIRKGFTNVTHAIELIQKAGIPLSLVATIININEKDLELMYAYSHEKHLPFIHTIAVTKPVRGATQDVEKYRLQIKDAPEQVKKSLAKNTRLFVHGEHPMSDCGSYRDSFWITWNGNMTLCSFLGTPNVPTLNYDFKTSWNLLNKKLSLLKKPSKCINCKYESYCNKCPGKLYSECGDYSNPTDSFCSEARYLYEICTTLKEEGMK